MRPKEFNRMIEYANSQPSDLIGWKVPLVSASFGFVLLMLFYRSTLLSMVFTWSHSNTYTHGFMIFPVSFYLIWRRKEQLAALDPKPDYRAIVGILLVGFLWIVAKLAEVQVIQQFILVCQVILVFWAILGLRILREMAFPLAFLFFSVPFGEVLIPWLLHFTADFTVGLIHLTGIPIYRDGNTFSLPTGSWSVVEACSGIRYLIASVTLGFLFAYLNYNSFWRRAAFVAISVIVPIVANGLRAFMIVMIGHFSGMKYAVGVDHLIYGWLFFGLVMLLMFWIGSFWSESPVDHREAGLRVERDSEISNGSSFVIVSFLALVAAAIWPLLTARLADASSVLGAEPKLEVPEAAQGWHVLEKQTGGLVPNYHGATTKINVRYSKSVSRPVDLFIFYYRNQQQGKELINSSNVVVSTRNKVWNLLDVNRIRVDLDGRAFQVNQWRLASSQKNLLVWEWYWIGDTFVANDLVAKVLEVKARLTGANTDSAAILVSAEYNDSIDPATDVLRRFVEQMLPVLQSSLELAARQ